MRLLVNPGSGPVAADLERATRNLSSFITDLRGRGHTADIVAALESSEPMQDGRYRWTIRSGTRSCQVDMPGHELTRFVKGDGTSPFQCARLFVNGSSWLWPFALEMVEYYLFPREE